jgi:hypothetical protein
LGKKGLVLEHVIGNTMHFNRPGFDLAIGIYILVVMTTSELAVDQLHAAYFNNTVALAWI